MKKLALLLLVATFALAGDDYQQTVAYTGTAACSTQLRAKVKYAVRCTTDCYVHLSSTGTATDTATTNDVLLSAGKLYDAPTTSGQRFICFIQSAAGGNGLIYLNRGTWE
jgi:hypothetical protein